MYCKKCSARFNERSLFCSYCGNKLAQTEDTILSYIVSYRIDYNSFKDQYQHFINENPIKARIQAFAFIDDLYNKYWDLYLSVGLSVKYAETSISKEREDLLFSDSKEGNEAPIGGYSSLDYEAKVLADAGIETEKVIIKDTYLLYSNSLEHTLIKGDKDWFLKRGIMEFQ